MNSSYTIRYLKTAENDLIEIFDYIKQDKPTAATTYLERFDESISQLASKPFIGMVPKDGRLKKLGYRILVVDKYLVFYIVKSTTVQIRRVIHGARQYEFLV
jgi:toxin ParE1/3/4